VISADVFRDQPVLTGDRVRLEPLTVAVLEEYLQALADPEVRRLTGSHADFSREAVERWLASRADEHDRADWAIVRIQDGAFLGEAVVHDLDPDNETAGYRLFLAAPHVFGLGYGTEVTRLVVDHALHGVGLHRLELEVFEHNPRAQRVYEKSGFVLEGRRREALLWEGRRYDSLVMAVLRSTG
jgi:RimJ/RimL family protein N-acetyltransferase